MPGMTESLIDDHRAQLGVDWEQAGRWLAYGFDAADAAPWITYRITPTDARAWEGAGFHGGDMPSRAALWHHNRFTPAQAIAWGALPERSPGSWVFAPSIAALFRDA